MSAVHLIGRDEAEAVLTEARPTYYRGAVKSGDANATQWRQDMQVAWLKAAIMAQERRDEPEFDPQTLEMPCRQI